MSTIFTNKAKQIEGIDNDGLRNAKNAEITQQRANFAAIGGAVGNVLDMLPPINPGAENERNTAANQIYDQATNAMMNFPPWGTAIALGLKGIKAAGGMSDASQGLGKGIDNANMAAKFLIPGAGWMAKKTESFSRNQDAYSTSGFGGLNSSALTAEANAGAKLLFGRDKANALINKQKRMESDVASLSNAQKDRNSSLGMNVQDQQMQNQLSLSGGMGNIAFGKEGLKLAKKEAQNILAKRRNIKPVIEAESEDWSIIPGGALHAHRNNLKVHDSELAKQVTGKGVPVVTFEEGGEIEQHAEIERGEIIFREEVSKKLEELWKDGSEEAMIEAGKMISEEIVNNTKDKSGEYEIEN